MAVANISSCIGNFTYRTFETMSMPLTMPFKVGGNSLMAVWAFIRFGVDSLSFRLLINYMRDKRFLLNNVKNNKKIAKKNLRKQINTLYMQFNR